jgi:hypothetical protein
MTAFVPGGGDLDETRRDETVLSCCACCCACCAYGTGVSDRHKDPAAAAPEKSSHPHSDDPRQNSNFRDAGDLSTTGGDGLGGSIHGGEDVTWDASQKCGNRNGISLGGVDGPAGLTVI